MRENGTSVLISDCRACGSTNLEGILDLGVQPLSGVFPKKGDPDPLSGPLSLIICRKCALVQLAHNYPLSLMYGENYGYRSGLNESMASHLQLKAKKLSTGSIPERDLHRIRIITKQIRYVSQIVKHCYSDFNFHEISFESLRKIETVAGKWHDYLVRIELLERFIKKHEHSDHSDSIKYQAFLTDCKKELELAYKNACRVVKHEMKTKIIYPEN